MDKSSQRLGVEIGGQFYLAHRYARAAVNRALEAHQVELRHVGVLDHIAESGPLSQRELIDRLQVDKSTMVHIVDDLERQGLAERHRNERDRRSFTIHITPAGREHLATAQAASGEVMSRLLRTLSPTEQHQLHRLLARFIDQAAQGE